MRGRTLALAGLALVLTVPALGCSDDDGGGLLGGGGGGLATVSGALAALPDDGENQFVVWGDLTRAAEIAGLDRPSDPGDSEAVIDYLNALTGTVREDGDTTPPVAVMPPEAARTESAADMSGFVADVGWSILQVDRFVERQSPPDSITLLAGDFDDGALTDAMGEPDDDVWVAGSGEPGEISVDEITPARPIGESLWLSRRAGDGLLSITRDPDTQATADAALAGDAEGGVLADDASLAAVAAALDEQSVYAAQVARPGIDGLGALGPRVSPEEARQLCEEMLPEPTSAVATGVASDDEGPVVLFALAHLSADAASANAEALENIVANGSSVLTREPWSERFELDGVETTGDDGLVVVARLRPVEPIGTRLGYDILARRDNLIASCSTGG
jgi:hypothetical protein